MKGDRLNVRSYCAFFLGIVIILAAPYIVEYMFALRYFQVRVNLMGQRTAFEAGFYLVGFLLSEYGLAGYVVGLFREYHKARQS